MTWRVEALYKKAKGFLKGKVDQPSERAVVSDPPHRGFAPLDSPHSPAWRREPGIETLPVTLAKAIDLERVKGPSSRPFGAAGRTNPLTRPLDFRHFQDMMSDA